MIVSTGYNDRYLTNWFQIYLSVEPNQSIQGIEFPFAFPIGLSSFNNFETFFHCNLFHFDLSVSKDSSVNFLSLFSSLIFFVIVKISCLRFLSRRGNVSCFMSFKTSFKTSFSFSPSISSISFSISSTQSAYVFSSEIEIGSVSLVEISVFFACVSIALK